MVPPQASSEWLPVALFSLPLQVMNSTHAPHHLGPWEEFEAVYSFLIESGKIPTHTIHPKPHLPANDWRLTWYCSELASITHVESRQNTDSDSAHACQPDALLACGFSLTPQHVIPILLYHGLDVSSVIRQTPFLCLR